MSHTLGLCRLLQNHVMTAGTVIGSGWLSSGGEKGTRCLHCNMLSPLKGTTEGITGASKSFMGE